MPSYDESNWHAAEVDGDHEAFKRSGQIASNWSGDAGNEHGNDEGRNSVGVNICKAHSSFRVLIGWHHGRNVG